MDNRLMKHSLPRPLAGQTRPQMPSAPEDEQGCGDLWEVLSDLGSRLVQKHGFSVADLQGCSTYVNRTTEPLVRFLVWLQHTPEAGDVLRDMGLWPEGINEGINESAEATLNRGEPLPPELAPATGQRKRRNSVA